MPPQLPVTRLWDPGYRFVIEQTQAALQKTNQTNSQSRVCRNLSPALWANSECVGHCRRVPRARYLLLRKILSQVAPIPQQ
jgi:hypothetical protein